MPTRPPREPFNALVLAALAVIATAVLIAAGGGSKNVVQQGEASWLGLAGAQRPRVAVGQRVIVLLRAPALADRVGRVGGLATDEEERRWMQTALSSQKLLVARLRVQGVIVQPEFSYTRTVNGFSAAFDARGIALLERAPEVAGVYPVRAAYPASLSSRLVAGSEFGERPNISLSDKDGRGVTIALLDTGVDRAHPFLRGRVASGIDIVGGDAGALAAPQPDEPAELERHGTEMAGLLVGSGGPGALAGVAPGAPVLPIRVAGWQRDAPARWAVYGRTDQVLAGLERAVAPTGDGDAHDAARVALVGVAEPFAAFADGPLALAAAGATRLDTLVVAPAGNDGSAGPGYGSVAGPGGSPAVLTVGAVDLRPRFGQVRVVLRAGLRVELDAMRPLAGAVTPTRPLDVGIGGPRSQTTEPAGYQGAVPLLDFFDRRGSSLVAGRAALVPPGIDPNGAVANAAQAGAVAVLLYGADLPAGGVRSLWHRQRDQRGGGARRRVGRAPSTGAPVSRRGCAEEPARGRGTTASRRSGHRARSGTDRPRRCDRHRGRREPRIACSRPSRQPKLAHGKSGIRPPERVLPPTHPLARRPCLSRGSRLASIQAQPAACVARSRNIDPDPGSRASDEQARGHGARGRRRNRHAGRGQRNPRAVDDYVRATRPRGPRLRSPFAARVLALGCRPCAAELRRGLGPACGRRARRAAAVPPRPRTVEPRPRPHRTPCAPPRRAAGSLLVRSYRSRPDRLRTRKRRLSAQVGRLRDGCRAADGPHGRFHDQVGSPSLAQPKMFPFARKKELT